MIAGALCRCGHLLDCCADCRAWLVEHSPRISAEWESWLKFAWWGRWPISTRYSDAVEADNQAYFEAGRWQTR